MVVTPPHAAAMVPVSNVSEAAVPPNGSSMWVCASMPPGITYLPVASIVRSAVTPRPAAWPGARIADDRLAVDQDVAARAAGGRDDRPVGDECACHVFLLVNIAGRRVWHVARVSGR